MPSEFYGPIEERYLPVVKRVSQRSRRVNPLETVLVERETSEEGGDHRKWMNGRANIVDKAWQREGSRACPTTHGFSGFVNEHCAPSPCECDGSRKAIRPGANDDRVISTGVGPLR